MRKICTITESTFNGGTYKREKLDASLIKKFACVRYELDDRKDTYLIWAKTKSIDEPWDCMIGKLDATLMDCGSLEVDLKGFNSREETMKCIDDIIKNNISVVEIALLSNTNTKVRDDNKRWIENIIFNKNGVVSENEIDVDSMFSGIILENKDMSRLDIERLEDRCHSTVALSPYINRRWYRVKCITDNTVFIDNNYANSLHKCIFEGKTDVLIDNKFEAIPFIKDNVYKTFEAYVPIRFLYNDDLEKCKNLGLILSKDDIIRYKLFHDDKGRHVTFAIKKDKSSVPILLTYIDTPIGMFSSQNDLEKYIDLVRRSKYYLLKVLVLVNSNEINTFDDFVKDNFTLSCVIHENEKSKMKEKKLQLTSPQDFRLTHNDIDEMFTKDSLEGICKLYFTMKNDKSKIKYRICTPKDLPFTAIEDDLKLFFKDKLDLLKKDDESYKFVKALREPVYNKLDLSKYKN